MYIFKRLVLNPISMSYLKLLYVAFITVLLITSNTANSQNIILSNGYAHNDYWHKRPLFDALDKGFTYVEADVFLKGDKLVVAHYFLSKKNRTLEELYLKPLLNYVEENRKREHWINDYPITLMIDIKSNANKTYEALELLLKKYKSILSGYEDGQLKLKNVTIILTGHKPNDILTKRTNRLVFMDDNLKNLGKDSSNHFYKTASCKYNNLLKWKGKGSIPEIDRKRLEYYVTKAHLQGKKVRLWASPENKAVWAELLRCNVDLINTDKLGELRNFLISELSLTANQYD